MEEYRDCPDCSAGVEEFRKERDARCQGVAMPGRSRIVGRTSRGLARAVSVAAIIGLRAGLPIAVTLPLLILSLLRRGLLLWGCGGDC